MTIPPCGQALAPRHKTAIADRATRFMLKLIFDSDLYREIRSTSSYKSYPLLRGISMTLARVKQLVVAIMLLLLAAVPQDALAKEIKSAGHTTSPQIGVVRTTPSNSQQNLNDSDLKPPYRTKVCSNGRTGGNIITCWYIKREVYILPDTTGN